MLKEILSLGALAAAAYAGYKLREIIEEEENEDRCDIESYNIGYDTGYDEGYDSGFIDGVNDPYYTGNKSGGWCKDHCDEDPDCFGCDAWGTCSCDKKKYTVNHDDAEEHLNENEDSEHTDDSVEDAIEEAYYDAAYAHEMGNTEDEQAALNRAEELKKSEEDEAPKVAKKTRAKKDKKAESDT